MGPTVSDSKKKCCNPKFPDQRDAFTCAAQDKSKLWLHVAAIVPMSLSSTLISLVMLDRMTPSPVVTREINLKRILPKIYQVNYSLLANIATCYI